MTHAFQVPSKQRALVYRRDDHRCVMCGCPMPLTIQHRQSRGMGGIRLLVPAAGLLALCAPDNDAAEGSKQGLALRHGIKVRRWVKDPALVPVWYGLEGSWFVLRLDGLRVPTTMAAAARMMTAVYGPDWEKTL